MRTTLIGRIRQAQLGIAMAALVVMMLVTVADVFMRYVFGSPIRGAYGMTEACLVVFVFHGISMTFVGRRSVVIDLIDGMVARGVLRGLIRVADVLSVVALLAIGWAMLDPARQAFEYGDAKPELGLPLVYLWGAAMLGVIGTVISALGTLFSPATAQGGHDPR